MSEQTKAPKPAAPPKGGPAKGKDKKGAPAGAVDAAPKVREGAPRLQTYYVNTIRARLAKHGAQFEEATPIPGWRRCYVFDPFGNKIELDEIPR